MAKRTCYSCVHRVLELEQSDVVSHDGYCWSCKEYYWQDETICLQSAGVHNYVGWALHCRDFKRLELADGTEKENLL